MEELFALIRAHQWVAVAAVVIGFLTRLLKSDTKLPITLPPRVRPWLALVFGAASGMLETIVAGTPVDEALLGGLVAALTAIAGHDALIEGLRGGREVPLPGLTKKKDGPTVTTTNATMLVLCVALTLPACGLLSNVSGFLGAQYDKWGPQAELMFDLLCGRSEAEARGLSLDAMSDSEQRDFVEDVCRSEDAIQTYGPLVEAALEQGQGRAMARARARAADRGDQ